jgi:hypothetical protein
MGGKLVMKLLMENWREYLTEDEDVVKKYPVLVFLSRGDRAKAMQLANQKGIGSRLPKALANRVIEYTNRPAFQTAIATGEYQKQNKKWIAQRGYQTFAHGPEEGLSDDLKDPQTKEANHKKLNIAATFYVWALERGLNPTQPYLEYKPDSNITNMRVDLK